MSIGWSHGRIRRHAGRVSSVGADVIIVQQLRKCFGAMVKAAGFVVLVGALTSAIVATGIDLLPPLSLLSRMKEASIALSR
jgi:hypothetical protein